MSYELRIESQYLLATLKDVQKYATAGKAQKLLKSPLLIMVFIF